MLHRVVLGAMERFIGVLIEHFGGKFPVWLAPVQVMIMNITDDQEPYVRNIYNAMIEEGIRADLDTRNEKLGLKIRESVVKKIPYMVIAGKNEMESNSIAVRIRDGGELKDIKWQTLSTELRKTIHSGGEPYNKGR